MTIGLLKSLLIELSSVAFVLMLFHTLNLLRIRPVLNSAIALGMSEFEVIDMVRTAILFVYDVLNRRHIQAVINVFRWLEPDLVPAIATPFTVPLDEFSETAICFG